MEQTQVRVREHHPVFIRRLHALLVHDAPARRRQVLDAAPPRTVHVVREGEERIAAARDALQLREPFPLLFRAQGRRRLFELRLPLLLLFIRSLCSKFLISSPTIVHPTEETACRVVSDGVATFSGSNVNV